MALVFQLHISCDRLHSLAFSFLFFTYIYNLLCLYLIWICYSILKDVSDRVEKLDYTVNPLRSLEKNGKLVVRDDWFMHLHEVIRADLRKYRGYFGNSVRDLMRALRNKVDN